MLVEIDLVGVVREHRWASVAVQTRRLKEAGCSKVFDLAKTDRQDIERLAQPERVLCLLFAFLLAKPKRRGGMMADFDASLARIEKRGGAVRDVSTGLTNKGETRPSFLAVVKDQARRSQQGLHSADNGRNKKKGRPHEAFSQPQYAEAKAIWRNLIDYANEDIARAALAEIKSTAGRPFSAARARRAWGNRKKR